MKHIALTLGPIVETISLGRKTAEIWAGSYLFSLFMKNVINDLRKLEDVDFIIPYVKDNTFFELKDYGVGMFHDRFIFATNTVSLENVEDILQKHKDALSDSIADSISEKDTSKLRTFLNQYIQTYLVELNETFTHPIIEISEILDSVELHVPIVEIEKDYLRLFLNRNTLLKSKIAKDSFGANVSFDSIPEIAARNIDLKLKEVGEEESNTYLRVEKSKTFKQVYKYIAIVHADGDNLGSYIKSQENPNVVSQRLFEFDKGAVTTIKDYGAVPIFVGGDDLLFFAPIINDKKTIFDLLDTLNELFKSSMKSDDVTLSFGVSITYYKYPLYEALEQSRNALFDKAKKYPTEVNPLKNATHISARKHSGQSFDVTLSKSEKSESIFTELLKGVLFEDIELPHSVHHKLDNYKKVFLQIPDERVIPTFNHIFNKEIHQDKFKDGLLKIRELMVELGRNEDNLKRLFSLLSIIKLLRGDRDG